MSYTRNLSLVAAFLFLYFAGNCFGQVITPAEEEVPIPAADCIGYVTGEIQGIKPTGTKTIPEGQTSIELEFSSKATVENGSMSDIKTTQTVFVHEAIEDANNPGTYSKGAELDKETESRTLDDCIILKNWKVEDKYTYTVGAYYTSGYVYLDVSPDLKVLLDSDEELFHVKDSITSN